jgi:Peptidase family S41
VAVNGVQRLLTRQLEQAPVDASVENDETASSTMRRLVCGGILVCAGLAASVAWARKEVETAPSNLPALRGDAAPTSPVLYRTLHLIRDKYVEPARIVPSKLFEGALRQLERDLVPVVVSNDDATGVVVVHADEHAKSFALSEVKGLWDVAARLQEVFAFLRSALPDQGMASRDLEIAACKGLLETLDRDGGWIDKDGHRTADPGVAVSPRREGSASAAVESRQLQPGIGYIHIRHIGPSTADELARVLEGFRGSLEGVVLDLRDSHGGLFAEAAKVADAFLEEGSLALARGAAEGSEEKKARKDGTEPRCPIVLLTSSTTASGSELIASTLQKNERAVVVGETSSGLGKIQLVFPSAVANATIELTVAEFQAPAGTSIHGVGVVPDIELRAARVDPLQPRFFGPLERARARDRLHVFADAKPKNQPEATIWYASDADDPGSIDVGEQSSGNIESDFALRLATDLIAQLSGASRSKQIDSVRSFLERVREREMAALDAKLRALGIDWSSRPSTASDGPQSSDFAVKVSTDRAQNTTAAGGSMTLVIAVTNRSKLPAYQVRAITKSQNADYHAKELLFGSVGPGQTVIRRVSFGRCDRASSPTGGLSGAARRACRLSISPAEREDIVKVIFSAQQGEAPAPAELRPITTAQPQVPSEPSLQAPLSIEVGKLPLTQRQERIRIKGLATGSDGIEDVRVFANERKILYRRVSPSPAALPFEADVPLAPGINVLRVLARNRNDVTSTRTFIVRRDGPQGEPLPARRPIATD